MRVQFKNIGVILSYHPKGKTIPPPPPPPPAWAALYYIHHTYTWSNPAKISRVSIIDLSFSKAQNHINFWAKSNFPKSTNR